MIVPPQPVVLQHTIDILRSLLPRDRTVEAARVVHVGERDATEMEQGVAVHTTVVDDLDYACVLEEVLRARDDVRIGTIASYVDEEDLGGRREAEGYEFDGSVAAQVDSLAVERDGAFGFWGLGTADSVHGGDETCAGIGVCGLNYVHHCFWCGMIVLVCGEGKSTPAAAATGW